MDSNLTQNLVRELFDYVDGKLLWKVLKAIGTKVGEEAGTITVDGYRRIKINGKKYLTHRIVYLYHYGYIPKEIDHIDNNKLNNDIKNLRSVTRSEQMQNTRLRKDNKSGIKGVNWSKVAQKWTVRIRVNNKRYFGGYFTDINEAKKAATILRNNLHSKFTNHG